MPLKINAGAIIATPKRQLLAQKRHMTFRSVHPFLRSLSFYPNPPNRMPFNRPDTPKSAPSRGASTPYVTRCLDPLDSASQPIRSVQCVLKRDYRRFKNLVTAIKIIV